MIVNDDSRVVNKLEASLSDDARVVFYACHMFIVQATGLVREDLQIIVDIGASLTNAWLLLCYCLNIVLNISWITPGACIKKTFNGRNLRIFVKR
jgi:hypothetical protein